MNPLERNLRESMKPRAPSPGFAEKVIAHAYASDKPRKGWFHLPGWQWQAALALLVLMLGGALFVHQQQRRAEDERKKDQLIVGLRITASKLQKVQDRLTKIQLHLEQQ